MTTWDKTQYVQPYLSEYDPTRFRLRVRWTGHSDNAGRAQIQYDLSWRRGPVGTPYESLFSGCDMWAHGTEREWLRTAWFWLTLRPGDTDAEFFAEDRPEQAHYRTAYAEVLSAYFGGDE